MLKATLNYDRGTIVIRGLAHIPFSTPDPRSNNNNILRAQALYYVNIVEYLKQSGIEFADYVFSDVIASPDLNSNNNNDDGGIVVKQNKATATAGIAIASSLVSLRDYQQKALDNWIRAGMRGSVVLPTGSGKTIVGIKAIETVNASSLIIVPTLDLMDQWTAVLSKYFRQSTKIGNLGGGIDDVQPITVSTYDSAYLRAPLLGNKFSLIIFDEVHHLAALGYRTIAEQMAAPYRLGLTATIEREDELHRDLPRLVGEVVYQASPDTLAKKKHLASYEIERRKVELLPEELKEYRENMSTYRQCLNKIGKTMGGYYNLSLEKLIMISGKNPTARQALLARNKATNIALNSKAKIEELKEILAENQGKKTIIFTQHNSLVYHISDKFLIPFITYKTNKDERQDVLTGFKEGRYMAIVTSKVLDEGIDVPDAELGIIVSGTGSAREFIQRLGRLLRPKPKAATSGAATDDEKEDNSRRSKKAKLIEIISSETREETITGAKRKRALRSIRQDGEEEGDEEDHINKQLQEEAEYTTNNRIC